MFTLITPTGDRPEAFALCEEWMSHQTAFQTHLDWEWIVVDDGVKNTVCTKRQVVMRVVSRPPIVGSTLGANLRLGLSHVRGDKILVIEDDDYYGPKYVENALKQLDNFALVGETPSRYFHVGRRVYREFGNDQHASLCQTAFRSSITPLVLAECDRSKFIDMELWRHCGRTLGHLYPGSQTVGIKGMPGRPGISTAHEACGAGWQGDIDLSRLRQWIGKDGERYRPYGKL